MGLARRLAIPVAVTVAVAVRLADGAVKLFLFTFWVLKDLQVCNEHAGRQSCQGERLGRAVRRTPRRYLELIEEIPELGAQGVIIAARDTVGHAQCFEHVGHIADPWKRHTLASGATARCASSSLA